MAGAAEVPTAGTGPDRTALRRPERNTRSTVTGDISGLRTMAMTSFNRITT